MTALIWELCPAKINLGLAVLGERADGYHEIETVMQSVSLYDCLFFSPETSVINVISTHPEVPDGDRNLVYRAARLIQERYCPEAGATIVLEKRIPLAAGLAGGSTDAAGAIRGLNRLWELGLGEEEQQALAQELGSDVVFCLHGGTALARGRGEIVSQLPDWDGRWVVLVRPPLAVSTAEVYHAFRVKNSGTRQRLQTLLQALWENDWRETAGKLYNDLEQVTLKWFPEIVDIKQEMLQNGAGGVLMSGSGPSVFGLFPDLDRARRTAQRFQAKYSDVFIVESLGAK